MLNSQWLRGGDYIRVKKKHTKFQPLNYLNWYLFMRDEKVFSLSLSPSTLCRSSISLQQCSTAATVSAPVSVWCLSDVHFAENFATYFFFLLSLYLFCLLHHRHTFNAMVAVVEGKNFKLNFMWCSTAFQLSFPSTCSYMF